MGGVCCGISTDRCRRCLGVGRTCKRYARIIDFHARARIYGDLQPQRAVVGKQGTESRGGAQGYGELTVRNIYRGMGFRPEFRTGRGGVPDGKGHVIGAIRHCRAGRGAEHALVGHRGGGGRRRSGYYQ